MPDERRKRTGPASKTGAASQAGPFPAASEGAVASEGAAASAGGVASEGGVASGGQEVSGPQLARAVLDAAKVRREAARSARPRRVDEQGRPLTRRARGYSGPGPDPRDPQLFGAVLAKLVKTRGWQRPAAEATVFGDWAKVVGAEIAEHCRPTKLENRELTIEAESTAWATQLRLLSGKLLAGIAGQVGHNVVIKLHIHGPAAPSWNRGARRVRGRGPRDTYG